jgi:hypothetical protein
MDRTRNGWVASPERSSLTGFGIALMVRRTGRRHRRPYFLSGLRPVFGGMLWGAAARKAPLAVLQRAALLLRAVGWLEHPQPFTSGDVKSTVTSKLKAIADQTRAAYPQYCFRGVVSCSLCLFAGLPSPGPIWSQENIFVPGTGVVYVAPSGITHYIEAHSYPPAPGIYGGGLTVPRLWLPRVS